MEKETIKKMTGGELARWLHDTYEREAKGTGWDTQESCKVDFDNLPEKNKSTMLRVAQAIQVELIVPLTL